MWVYRSGFMYPEKQIILYEYQKTRNASHPREFLKDYSGICVTDGYQVYHTLEKEKEDLRKQSVLYLIMNQIRAIYREEGNRQIMMRSDIKLPQPFASWSNSL